MEKRQWIGTWAGGRIAAGKHARRIYWIEKQVDGTRYRVRLQGVRTEPEAVEEYRVWRASPATYKPPAVRHAEALLEAEEAERAVSEGAVYVTPEVIGAFVKDLSAGYANRKPTTDGHVQAVHRCLSDWATSPALMDRDLRSVTLHDLQEQLDQWNGKKNRIAALKSLTAWMRWKGLLKRADDPTLDLRCIQARAPTPTQREAKVYSVDTLQRTYRHIRNPDVRDLFRVRLMTGLHETEIRRIAEGHAVIREIKDGGIIAATVDVVHKSGSVHRQSVDAPTLAALRRMQARGVWLGIKTLARNRASACKAANAERLAECGGKLPKGECPIPPVYIGHLRHTFITLATECGEVHHPQKGGVPLDIVTGTVGHRSDAMARRHYLGAQVPPLVTIPVALFHPDDPA